VKHFTWDEISRHNNNSDCWIVVDGGVYDITNWINKHPGGETIATLAGEDASAMIHSCHFSDISNTLKTFKIGEIINYKPDFTIYNDRFLSTLKKRVKQYYMDQNIDYRKTNNNLKSILYTSLLLIFCWNCMYFFQPIGVLAAIPMGLATCSLIGSFGHERIHGNLLNHIKTENLFNRIVNNILWGIFIPFMPERYFQYEHIKHHNHPMNPYQDYDVYALKKFVRLSPDIKRKKYNSLQHIYAPFIYGNYIFIQVIAGYITPFFDNRRILKDTGVIGNITMTNSIAFMFHIAIPFFLTNIWWVALCSSIYFFSWQAAIYISSGVPHMTELNTSNYKSWSKYVCSTTKNLKCGHKFYDWLTGGLNYHLAHHLLPSIPKEHLPKIIPILKQTCKEFDYPFHTYDSFFSYYRDHYNFLLKLGNEEVPINHNSDII